MTGMDEMEVRGGDFRAAARTVFCRPLDATIGWPVCRKHRRDRDGMCRACRISQLSALDPSSSDSKPAKGRIRKPKSRTSRRTRKKPAVKRKKKKAGVVRFPVEAGRVLRRCRRLARASGRSLAEEILDILDTAIDAGL